MLRRGLESLGSALERVYLKKKRKIEESEKDKRDLMGENIMNIIGHSSTVVSVVFSPNGKYLASGSWDNTIGVWSVSSGERIKTITNYSTVLSVVFSPNGEYLASGSRNKTIEVWSVLSGERIKTLIGHSSAVLSVVFSPNEEYLASGSKDCTIGVWRV